MNRKLLYSCCLVIFIFCNYPICSSYAWLFGPKDYEECIIKSVKPGMSDHAINTVRRACRSKFPIQTNSDNSKSRWNVDFNFYAFSKQFPNLFCGLTTKQIAEQIYYLLEVDMHFEEWLIETKLNDTVLKGGTVIVDKCPYYSVNLLDFRYRNSKFLKGATLKNVAKYFFERQDLNQINDLGYTEQHFYEDEIAKTQLFEIFKTNR